MTDPGTADRTYIGPMTPDLVEEIIAKVNWKVQWNLYLLGNAGLA